MKRTAEELMALREKRDRTDPEKNREERRRLATRQKRRKMGDGEVIKELGLSTAEFRGLVLDAERPGTRERWARDGSRVRELPKVPAVVAEAAE